MAKGTLLIVGAAGDVGQGIVGAAIEAGWNVVAAGRDRAKLEAVAARHSSASLTCVAGDIATQTGADALWITASVAFGGFAAVVVTVNAANPAQPLAAWSEQGLVGFLAGNVATHFVAAKAWLPRLPDSGMFIGIGGGTADFIFPGMVPMSMAQAALRMLYRGLAKEYKGGAHVRELMIVSMVAGASNRASAAPDWIASEDVGRHICAILANPQAFAGPVLHLRERTQVGSPETPRDR
jgi:NAD(P)-dependent dehydrogenase (short-subunit alcohol dehydrogenase family)